MEMVLGVLKAILLCSLTTAVICICIILVVLSVDIFRDLFGK